MKKWGETHCPMCEKPIAQDGDYDKYEPEEGDHLCWNYPFVLGYGFGSGLLSKQKK